MANKKKQSLLSRVGKLSTAKKLFLFLVVFAVIGGGYMAYSSFAYDNNCTKPQPNEYLSAEEYYFEASQSSKCSNLQSKQKLCVSIQIQRLKDGDWHNIDKDTSCTDKENKVTKSYKLVDTKDNITYRGESNIWIEKDNGTIVKYIQKNAHTQKLTCCGPQ